MPETRHKSRLTLIEQRIARFVRDKLEPLLYRASVPLTVRHREIGGEPVPIVFGLVGVFWPLPVGAEWGRAWDTSWLRIGCTVPADWNRRGSLRNGTRLEAVIDLGFTHAQPGFQAEGLAYTLAGEPFKGLSPWNHYVPLDGDAGAPVDFWVAAAANPGGAGAGGGGCAPAPRGRGE